MEIGESMSAKERGLQAVGIARKRVEKMMQAVPITRKAQEREKRAGVNKTAEESGRKGTRAEQGGPDL